MVCRMVGVAVAVVPLVSMAQTTPGNPLTNLQLFRNLARDVATQMYTMAPKSDTSTIVLKVMPRDIAWVVEDDMILGIRNAGGHVVQSGGGLSAVCGLLEFKVRYENIRRDWIFGPKKVDRTVICLMHATISDGISGATLSSEDRQASLTDTVLVSDLERLESSTLLATKGVLPAEGVFENLAEPLIVLGTVAVAVILLFTVRS